MSIAIMAQQKSDGFFYYQNSREVDTRLVPTETQGTSFSNMNVQVNAPIGNGIFILLGASIIYIMIKMREIVR